LVKKKNDLIIHFCPKKNIKFKLLGNTTSKKFRRAPCRRGKGIRRKIAKKNRGKGLKMHLFGLKPFFAGERKKMIFKKR